MNALRTIPIPEIFVLWHPSCLVGEKLARRIYTWLRPGNGVGPQVFYRSFPAPEAPAGGLPPPIPGETRGTGDHTSSSKRSIRSVSNLQILLPLIDEQMVADPAWRYWLSEISTTTAASMQREILPVALDATAYNMPGILRELNFLRPAGLPLSADDSLNGPVFEAVARSLLKQLTEVMCRLLLPRPDDNSGAFGETSAAKSSLPKVSIFLSHAKADGTIPARRLRDYIYSQTQLAAFYDENDIAYGSMFSRIIQNDLNSPDTAALIAVRSAQYASRPWCRRELSLFRRPRPESVSFSGAQRWRLYPSVVVEAMEGAKLSALIPELGNSPVIRWSDDAKDLEELIVTTVLRDAMLSSFHSAMGASIPVGTNQIVINWLPDPTTLLHIPQVRGASELDVIHPGRGLSGLELDILFDYFPTITFRSFEEVLS